ncbi:MAG TPA: hypothetical protein VJ323_02100, partial [Bryobacteraceae bacterium]|nr:hypothetical protein [Bryobacteraceae bacterium]
MFARLLMSHARFLVRVLSDSRQAARSIWKHAACTDVSLDAEPTHPAIAVSISVEPPLAWMRAAAAAYTEN